MRRLISHNIKPNHGTETPGRLIFFDTESRKMPLSRGAAGHRLVLRLGVAISVRMEDGAVVRRRVYHFNSADQFWEWLAGTLDHRTTTWVMAHNLVFDLTQLRFWERLQAGEFRLSMPAMGDAAEGNDAKRSKRGFRGVMCVENRPQFIVARHAKGTVKFVDTGNYYSTSVREIGAAIGLPKLDADLWTDDTAALREYCERDAAIIESAMCGLLSEWRRSDLGTFQLTAPKLAMSSFRHRFMHHTITPPNDQDVRDLEREAYYGGRIDAFYVGRIQSPAGVLDPVRCWDEDTDTHAPQGPVYMLDVRSLYPSVMLAGQFPVRHHKTLHRPDLQTVDRLLRTFGGIATCLLDTTDQEFPVRSAGETYYATGRFTTCLAGDELTRAMKARIVVSVGRLQLYVCQTIFNSYVKYWWETRRWAEKCNEPHTALLCKMLLNSMSGKWAQRGHSWEDCHEEAVMPGRFNWCKIDTRTGNIRRFRNVFGNVQGEGDRREPPEAFPAISAFITAAGREVVRSLILGCPKRSVLYSDTDSLLVDQRGYDHLASIGMIAPMELGKLRCLWVERDGVIRGLRDYRFGDREVLAGIGRTRQECDDGSYIDEQWETPASIIGRPADGSVIIRKRYVHMTRAFLNGYLGDDGWVSPPVLFGVSGFVRSGNSSR